MLSRRLLLALSLGASLVMAAATTSYAGDVDTTAPETTATLNPELNENGWANEDVQVTLLAEDNEGGSGVDSITYSATGAQDIAENTVSGDETSFTITAEGVTVITYFATDNAGNDEAAETVTVRIDKTDPVITASPNPKKIWPPDKRIVTVTISGTITDALSGVDLTSGRFKLIDEYGAENEEGTFTINADGSFSFTADVIAKRKGRDRNGRTYAFEITAEDEAGNVAIKTVKVLVPHDRRRRNR